MQLYQNYRAIPGMPATEAMRLARAWLAYERKWNPHHAQKSFAPMDLR
jgi:hypothetical protein